ncbi:uncharacterized protein LOC135936089 isoform X2 [Cloeon dipterum]|uniref:uncharacterized protein LOC135936089 isoform X2 n=1 Tax=Cloeon dipterum TaxID=197152 RepID=UPI00321FD8D9
MPCRAFHLTTYSALREEKMPVKNGFVFLALLSSAVCFCTFLALLAIGSTFYATPCTNFPAPYFNEGENLSYENCGVEKNEIYNPWIVYLRQANIGCYGIAISPRTILASHCKIDNTESGNITAFVGQCAKKPSSFDANNCTDKHFTVKGVTEIILNPAAAVEEKIFLKLFKTERKLNSTDPICLFNRAADKKTGLASRHHRDFLYLMLLQRKRLKNSDILQSLKPRNLTPCEKCVNTKMSDVYNRLGLPPQSLLCVKDSGPNNDHELVNFYNGRHFLRGLKLKHHLLKDSCKTFVDILPFIEPIVRNSKNISVLSAIPAVTPVKKFSNDEDNLSFPRCGTKLTGRQDEDENEISHHISSEFETQQNGGHPWHADIFKKSEDLTACGGTLISKRAVLTAAHCIFEMNATDFEVSIGMYNKSLINHPSIQTNTPRKLISHPKYVSGQFHYDVGLMIFDVGFELTHHVRPICLWNEDTDLNQVTGKLAMAVGFGIDESNTLPESLKEIQLPIKAYKNCYQKDQKFFGKHLKPGDNFCAGYTNGTSMCHGDSGGGLAIEKEGRWFIRGVTSFGKSSKISFNGTKLCVCNRNSFTLFSDVAHYMEFIVANTPDVSFLS